MTNVLDQADDGSVALPVVLVETERDGPVNKSPTIGRIEQALVVAEDGSMALPVEVVKLSEDGSTFKRVSGGTGGGGGDFDGNVSWENVTNKPQSYPPAAHNHDDRYYTKDEIDGSINHVASTLQGKVMTKPDDEPDYLVNKVDSVTLDVDGNELKVKNVDGLLIGIAQLNTWLSGTSGNIQDQLDGINDTLAAITAGMRYRGKFETYADLIGVGNKENGDLAVVLADENRDGARSLYVYNESLGFWDFVGAFEFSDEFIAMSDTPASYAGADGKYVRVDETNGKLVFADVYYGDLANKPASSITQIDDAVEKRHEHVNKNTLDRVGIDEQDRITIDGIPYVPAAETPPKRYLIANRTGPAQTLASGTTNCVFNNIIAGDIPYSASTGVFTLEAGKTYRVSVAGSMITSGFVILHLVDVNTNTVVNSGSGIWALGTKYDEASAGPLLTYVTPETTQGYRIRTGTVNGTGSLRSTYVKLEVQEI